MIVVYPDWDIIVSRCNKKIHDKYSKRGNSWIDAPTLDLITRIRSEYSEMMNVFDKANVDENKLMEEAHDLLNQVAMLITVHQRRK